MIYFIRFYSQLTSRDNAIVNLIAGVSIGLIYFILNRCKFGVDNAKTDRHSCIHGVCQRRQPNVKLMSLMLREVITKQTK